MTAHPPFSRTLRQLCARLFLGSALVSALVALPAVAETLPEIQHMIRAGQYEPALDRLETWLKKNPNDAQGRFLQGLAYTETGRQVEAIRVFTRLTEDFPELPEPYNNLAVLYAQQKDYDKARKALEMAIRTHPSYAIAYENLGDIYAKLASQAYDRALQLDGDNTGAQSKLALIRDLITSSGGRAPTPKTNTAAVKPTVPAPTTIVPATPVVTHTPPPDPAAPPPMEEIPEPAPIKNATVIATTQGEAAIDKPEEPVDKPQTPPQPAPAPTPAPAPATTPANPGEQSAAYGESDRRAVQSAVQRWAKAWQNKDMKSYFAAYTANFTGGKKNRSQWEQERELRIAKRAGAIRVDIDTPQVEFQGDRAYASFHQRYSAGAIKSATQKVLVLTRHHNGQWLIQGEKTN